METITMLIEEGEVLIDDRIKIKLINLPPDHSIKDLFTQEEWRMIQAHRKRFLEIYNSRNVA